MSFSSEEIDAEFSDSTKIPSSARKAYGSWITDVTAGENGEVIGINGPKNPEDRHDL